jgi:tetratricopeptide (TPR) repeat protein
MFLGRPEELEPHLHEALRLNPRNVFVFMTYAYIGYAKLYLGEYQEAVTWLRRSVQSNPNSAPTHLSIAAAHALLGHTAEASAALEAALSLAPNWTLSRARSEHYAFSSNRAYRAFADRLLEALRIAGAPER